MDKTIELIKKILKSYLNLTVGLCKFKGQIIITLNCKEGGIGNTEVKVLQNFSQKTIDKL